MKDQKISILISNYNKEKYIDECISSCLNQNHNDLEIIVYDNNSKDNSINIIKKYLDQIIYKNKERISNYGPVNQIDILKDAFKISTGNIICLLEFVVKVVLVKQLLSIFLWVFCILKVVILN